MTDKKTEALKLALADSALDRMAENARELGLDYEPPCKTGSQCTNKCQQCEQPAQQPHCDDCGGFDPECPLEQPAQQQEPVAWMFQHEETGRTMCVDAQQVEWGFEKGNPRLKKIAPLYTSPQPAQQQEPVAWRTKNATPPGGYVLFQQYPQAVAELGDEIEPLYTSPPASKPWVPLTEFDIDQIPYSCSHADSRLIAFAIEAKLKERNA